MSLLLKLLANLLENLLSRPQLRQSPSGGAAERLGCKLSKHPLRRFKRLPPGACAAETRSKDIKDCKDSRDNKIPELASSFVSLRSLSSLMSLRPCFLF